MKINVKYIIEIHILFSKIIYEKQIKININIEYMVKYIRKVLYKGR